MFSCIRILVRTLYNAVTGRCPKTARLKVFWKIDFRLAKKISSPSRYDLFGTAAYKLGEIILYCFYYFVNIASDYIL